jgi:hypothetical protein
VKILVDCPVCREKEQVSAWSLRLSLLRPRIVRPACRVWCWGHKNEPYPHSFEMTRDRVIGLLTGWTEGWSLVQVTVPPPPVPPPTIGTPPYAGVLPLTPTLVADMTAAMEGVNTYQDWLRLMGDQTE